MSHSRIQRDNVPSIKLPFVFRLLKDYAIAAEWKLVLERRKSAPPGSLLNYDRACTFIESPRSLRKRLSNFKPIYIAVVSRFEVSNGDRDSRKRGTRLVSRPHFRRMCLFAFKASQLDAPLRCILGKGETRV